jgi:hypothetical protein
VVTAATKTCKKTGEAINLQQNLRTVTSVVAEVTIRVLSCMFKQQALGFGATVTRA